MKNIKRFSIFFLLVLLVACGGGSDPNDPNNPSNPDAPGTLSGILLAPSGGDVKDSLLLACFIQSNICNINSDNTQTAEISKSGISANFQFTNLADGNYAIFAFKDTNNDGDLRDIADYQGCFSSGNECAAVSPPTTNLTIQLETELPEVIPGSISGTLILPGQTDGSSSLQNVTQPSFLRSPIANFKAGEVIVKFKRSGGISTLAEREPLASYQFGGQGLGRVRLLALEETALYATNLSAAETLALVADLNQRSDVEYAQPNYIKYALKVPNDTFYGVQWHYKAMNLENAWDVEDGTSNPVTVAVVDTGLLDHPELDSVNIGGYDFISDSQTAGDGNGRDANATDLGQESGYHGGHVAGTIAARSNNGTGLAGVSWGAKIVPVRVLGVTGGGTLADIIDGTLWAGGESVSGVPANPNPAKVINLSLGGEGPCSAAEVEAFSTLKDKGIVVVVAAGNSDDDAGFFSPANCDNVITVGATGPTGERAPYSNYGSKIDIMATGGDTSKTITFNGEQYPAGVWSTLKDDTGEFFFGAYQGTSMAAPHIAGIAALMLSKDPGLTPDQILDKLLDSATPLSASQCKRPSGNDCGAGLVDATAALGGGTTTPPPAPPPTDTVKTYVAALYCANLLCNEFDETLSELVEISDNKQQMPYRITDLSDGAYIVAGWQDLDKNTEIDPGEPFGFYDQNNDNTANDYVFLERDGVGSIDVLLKPYRASGSTSVQSMTSSIYANINQLEVTQGIAFINPEDLELFLKK